MTSDISCPECNGEPVDTVSINLSMLGYKARDNTYTCSDCGNSWACGHPVGEYDGPHSRDPVCNCCGSTGYLYQLHEGVEGLALRFKCPDCYYVWVREREFVDGAITVGYGEVMGTTKETKPWGYEDDG